MTNAILEKPDTDALSVEAKVKPGDAIDSSSVETEERVADLAEPHTATESQASTEHKVTKARNRTGGRRNISAKPHNVARSHSVSVKTETYSAEAPCRSTQTSNRSGSPALTAESETFMFNTCVPPETVLDMISAATQPGRTEPNPNWQSLSARCNTYIVGNRFQIAPKSKINRFARILHGAVYATPRGSRIEYTLATNPQVRVAFGICFALVNVILLAGLTTVITSGAGARYELIAVPVLLVIIGMSVASLGLWLSRKGEVEMERLLRNIDSSEKS